MAENTEPLKGAELMIVPTVPAIVGVTADKVTSGLVNSKVRAVSASLGMPVAPTVRASVPVALSHAPWPSGLRVSVAPPVTDSDPVAVCEPRSPTIAMTSPATSAVDGLNVTVMVLVSHLL